MRWFRNVLLPVFMLVMVVAMPLAESAIANDLPPPQATPVSDDAPIHIQGELVPPTVHGVCGPDNDEIIPAASQPEGVNPQPEISVWENSQATLTYAPLDGYGFPDGMSNVIMVDEIDADPCEEAGRFTVNSSMEPLQQTEPIITFNLPKNLYGLPHAGVNATVEYDLGDYDFGYDDDGLRLGYQLYYYHGHVGSTHNLSDKGRKGELHFETSHIDWLTNSCLSRKGSFEARFRFFIGNPTGSKTLFSQTSETVNIPCSVEVTPDTASFPASACGLDSEIDITVPAQDHMTITDSGWIDGTRTITYTPARYAFFPEGTQTEYTYSTSCITSFTFDVEEGAFLDRRDGVPVEVDVTFTLADAHPYDTVSIFHTQDGVVYPDDTPVEFPVARGVGGSTTVTISLPTIWGDRWHVPNHCAPRDPSIDISARITGYTRGVEDVNSRLFSSTETFPCTWLYETEPDITIDQARICGPNNDTFEITVEPDIATFTVGEWKNGKTIIDIDPGLGAYFDWYDKYVDMEFRDEGKPCLESISVDVDDETFLNRQNFVPVFIDVTFTLADTHPYDAIGIYPSQDRVFFPDVYGVFVPVQPGVGGSTTVTLELPAEWYFGWEPYFCPPADPTIDFEIQFWGHTDGSRVPNSESKFGPQTFPCTWIYETEPEITITRIEICGDNNDEFDITVEPNIATFTVGEWENGKTIIDIDPGLGAYFDWYDKYVDMEFRDEGKPCLESVELDVEDGAFVDAIPMYEVPLTATLTLADTHEYDSLQLTLYQNRASNPAGVNQIDVDVLPSDSGPATVNIAYPVMPEGTEALACVDGQIELEIAAIPYHPETGDLVHDAEITQKVSFPCSYLVQANPVIDIVQVEVCGPNNDTFEIASQPTGVGYTIDDWSDGETTVSFYAEEGYFFWTTDQIVHDFRDEDTPCPTDAPVPPVQAEVCGPNNDEIVIPPQPEGVTLDGDSGWIDGTRTITFAVDPAFITDGETEFSFTDESIACPITLNVTLIPSDGASLEGAEWQLFAPVAAQNVGSEPFAEGTVGARNSITIENLIAGDYRLVVNADGYEQIDRVLNVAEGETSQEIQLDVVALQPVETPTPEPTVIATPTTEATPSPSPATPAPEPTDEAAPVSGLPSTGSGLGTGIGVFALAGLLGAMVLGAIGNRRRIHS